MLDITTMSVCLTLTNMFIDIHVQNIYKMEYVMPPFWIKLNALLNILLLDVSMCEKRLITCKLT